MNTQIVAEAAHATLAGTMSFPQVVAHLLSTGVEYYHVNYVNLRKTYYSSEGEAVVTAIPYEGLPPVAAEFDAASLKANLLDSQLRNQHYRDFSRRAMAAGVQSYFAFLRGRRVTYLGRQGDQHIEWFPGSAPAQANT
jgi:uncharacterized protein YbcV (DUF1398 family)